MSAQVKDVFKWVAAAVFAVSIVGVPIVVANLPYNIFSHPFAVVFPKPDEIIIYSEKQEVIIGRDDQRYSSLYDALRISRYNGVYQHAVVFEAPYNESTAIEFVYATQQSVSLHLSLFDTHEREFDRLLFPYGGSNYEGEVIFYKDGQYRSGTITNSNLYTKVEEFII